MKHSDRLIVALDTPNLKGAEKLVRQLSGIINYFKIGLELFTSEGWSAVEFIKKHHARVFLDLKLHDIPNTVSRTASVICEHDVDMFNVHALGGIEMMKSVRQTVDEKCRGKEKKPTLLGVTILTSHREEDLKRELGIEKTLQDEVLSLAHNVKQSGLNGIVCSPLEVAKLRKELPGGFLLVTPGVRPFGIERGDQKRTLSPKEAFSYGSDFIVMGRPITEAKDPAKAATKILDEITE